MNKHKYIKYNNYFKNHPNYGMSKQAVNNNINWFYSQWQLIKNKIKITENMEVLEIGSGIGGFYHFLLKSKLNKYLGIELDLNAVKFSNNYFKTKKFRNSSLSNMNYKKKFDLIFAFEVLEHLENPLADIIKINKLLKKNGTFCGSTPYPFDKNITSDKTHVFVLKPKNWEKLFLQSGFNEVKSYPMSFFPYLWRINKKFNVIIPFYIPFKYFVSTTLIIAKKNKT